MRTRRLAELFITSAALSWGLGGCSDHQVSPWGPSGRPTLLPYLERPDLPRHVALAEQEAREQGLEPLTQLSRTLSDGTPLVVQAFEGRDTSGRRITALRASTRYGIVMAAGPLDSADVQRAQATELLLDGSSDWAFAEAQGRDLNADQRPDLVLRTEAGTLEVWGVGPTAAGRYAIDMAAPAEQLRDLDADGLPELVGLRTVQPSGVLLPAWTDAAWFRESGYTSHCEPARRLHQEGLMALEASDLPKGDEARLRRALELAWHGVLAGRSPQKVLGGLEVEAVPARLRPEFERHRDELKRMAKRSDADRAP